MSGVWDTLAMKSLAIWICQYWYKNLKQYIEKNNWAKRTLYNNNPENRKQKSNRLIEAMHKWYNKKYMWFNYISRDARMKKARYRFPIRIFKDWQEI